MNAIKKECMWFILSLIVGVCVSFLMLPELILHPTHVDILHNDPLQHFLGWEFYRHAPWSWPITYMQDLMYPIGTSVVFMDSFPLVSTVLKIFSTFLPEPFIWYGYVAIINASLLFYSGSLLLRILRPDVIFNIIGGLFVVLSSIFLWRFVAHFALTTQWIIIFELILILKPQIKVKQDLACQLLLIFISTGTHAYLTAILFPLCFALSWKLYDRKVSGLLEAIIIWLGSVVFGLMSAGFWGWFSNHTSGFVGGYSYFSNNLLALINPYYGSILLKTLPQGSGQYEGFAYLGLGIIIPLVGIFFLWFTKKITLDTKTHFPLIVVLIALFIFGLSNVIQVGSYPIRLFGIGEHSRLAHILGVFRCSGRFIWPVFYGIQFFVLITIYDLFDFNRRKQIGVLIVLLVLQLFDNSYLIASTRQDWNNYHHEVPILKIAHCDNEAWLNLAQYGIKHIFLLADITEANQKMAFTLIALKNHMTINNTQITRENGASEVYNAQQEKRFFKNELLPNTLYIGLNDKQYPHQYCSQWDDYVVCSRMQLNHA